MQETLWSVAALSALIWAVCFLLPRAFKADDPMAVSAAVLTAILALLLWLMISVGIRALALL